MCQCSDLTASSVGAGTPGERDGIGTSATRGSFPARVCSKCAAGATTCWCPCTIGN